MPAIPEPTISNPEPPILAGIPNGSDGSNTFTSDILYIPPGGLVIDYFDHELIGGVGTDSVPLDNALGHVNVWQVA